MRMITQGGLIIQGADDHPRWDLGVDLSISEHSVCTIDYRALHRPIIFHSAVFSCPYRQHSVYLGTPFLGTKG